MKQLLMSAALMACVVQAELIVREDFDYADGADIEAVSGWAGSGGGTVSNGLLTTSGALTLGLDETYTVAPSETEADYRVSELWFRFTARMTNNASARMGLASAGNNPASFGYATAHPALSGDSLYRLTALSQNSWTYAVPEYDTDYFFTVYGRLSDNSGMLKVELWFNPADPWDLGAATVKKSGSYAGSKMIGQVELCSIGDDPLLLDSLAVGTERSDVVGPYTNYALDARVRAGSWFTWGWLPEQVNDGIRTSTDESRGWLSNHPDSNTVEWIELDMGSGKSVERVDLYPADFSPGYTNGVLYPVDFLIQLSEDASSWTTVVTATNQPQPEIARQSFEFAAQTARYVRIYITNERYNPAKDTYRSGFAEIEVYAPPEIRRSVWVQPSWSRKGNLYAPGETADLTVSALPVYDLLKVNRKDPWVGQPGVEASVAEKDGYSCLKLQWSSLYKGVPIRWFQFHEPFLLDLSRVREMRFQVYAETAGDDLRLMILGAQQGHFFRSLVGHLEQGWNEVTVPLDFKRDKIINFQFETRWYRDRTFYIRDIEFVGIEYEAPQVAQLQVTLTDQAGVQLDQYAVAASNHTEVPLSITLPSTNGITYAEIAALSSEGDELGWNRVPFGTGDRLLKENDVPAANRMGVATHLKNIHNEGSPVDRLELIRRLGVRWARGGIGIESDAEGQYDWTVSDLAVSNAVRKGVEQVVLFTPPDWAFNEETLAVDRSKYQDYTDAVTARYPSLHVWELGNEPNLSATWKTNQTEWIDYTAAGYEVLKSNDPAHTVLNGAVSVEEDGWIDDVVELGLGAFIDDLALHTYGYSDTQWPYATNLMAAHGYPDKRIWVTETTIPYYLDSTLENLFQRNAMAEALVKRYLYARREGIRLFAWYELADGNFGTSVGIRQRTLGLFEFDGERFAPKETAMAYNVLATLLEEYGYDSCDETGNLIRYRFTKKSGETLIACRAGRPETLSVSAGSGTLEKLDIYGNRQVVPTDQNGQADVEIHEEHAFLIVRPEPVDPESGLLIRLLAE